MTERMVYGIVLNGILAVFARCTYNNMTSCMMSRMWHFSAFALIWKKNRLCLAFFSKNWLAIEGCTVMGIVGIPRVYRGIGVERGGNTTGMELDIAVTPRGWI